MENPQEPVPILQLPLDQLQQNIPSISSPLQQETDSITTATTNIPSTGRHQQESKSRRQRSKWTKEETQDLIKGCGIHGVGNWKKILEDPNLKFNSRTSVDLKDRFRTYFPEDYKRLYPNATSTRERASQLPLAPEAASFAKAKRKERTPFTKQEDDNLLIGFGKYGGKWSSIQKDEALGLSHRRSTDLRDRFRNAYPEKYVGAGFKPPPLKRKRREIVDQGDQIGPRTYEFHTDVGPPSELSSTAPVQLTETTNLSTATGSSRRELPSGISTSQPTSADTFNPSRLAWTSPHNVTRQQEREMAMKLRRALDMSNASEMMGDQDIPLDPGLTDVAYQPHGGQSHDTEALTGLLDAAAQRGSWKRD